MPFDATPQQDAIGQFLERFKAAATRFTWTVVDRYLRGTCDAHAGTFCPITATFYAETGQYVRPISWALAVAHLGLTTGDAGYRIVAAADYSDDCDITLRLSLIRQT